MHDCIKMDAIKHIRQLARFRKSEASEESWESRREQERVQREMLHIHVYLWKKAGGMISLGPAGIMNS